MSNGILPVQSTKPLMREWMLTRLFTDRGLSSEFYNRMMNLCNYDYPMSPDLRGLVESKFGFDMLGTIEQYSTREKPVLNSGLRASIRRVIPDEYYLEFLRLFDCTCCPPIIQTVADISEAVDGTQDGQLTIVRYIDGSGDQHIHLYYWDGADWILLIDSSSRLTGGVFDTFQFNNPVDSNWFYSLDEGATWLQDTELVLDPPVSSITIWFKNIVNGCIYTNVPQLPLQVSYCVDYFTMDITDPLFFFGTINGIQADDTANVLATYTNWEGNLTAIPFNNFLGSEGIVSIFRDSLTPAFSNMGTYVPFGGGPPVVWSPPITLCTTNCYQAVFTAADLSTEGLTAISAFGGLDQYDWGTIVPFDDPTASAQNLAGLIAGGFLEPTATLEYSFNGLEVTVTVCTVLTMYQFAWGTNAMDQGIANFTQL